MCAFLWHVYESMSQKIYIRGEKWLKRLSNENFRYVKSLHPLITKLTTNLFGFLIFLDLFMSFFGLSVNLMDCLVIFKKWKVQVCDNSPPSHPKVDHQPHKGKMQMSRVELAGGGLVKEHTPFLFTLPWHKQQLF